MDQNATKTGSNEESKQEEQKGDDETISLPNDYDMIFIYSPHKQKQSSVECVLNDEFAVFYAGETCEFTIIDVESFTKLRQVLVQGTRLDKLTYLSRPLSGMGVPQSLMQSLFDDEEMHDTSIGGKTTRKRLTGVRIVALDWVKDRKLVMIDLETFSVKVINVPLLGWIEDLVALPNQQSILMVYKHEIV